MKTNGTTPDEIRWPAVDDYQPSTDQPMTGQDRSADVNSMVKTTKKVLTTMVWLLAVMFATPAFAQLNGENLLGDMGVKSGTQPGPGLYAGTIYYRYFTDKVKGPNGETLVLDPTRSGSQTINAGVPMFLWITSKTFLGANFGMMAVMPFASGALEAPGLGLSEKASAGPSDMYVMPAQLGWHGKRFDAIAGFGLFAPTGRYAADASDNLGKGMWSYELSGGGTLYLDKARSFSLSTTAFWELHSKKEGSVTVDKLTIENVKVGQLMTLEGGIGKSFLHGAAHLGVAYYAQWKMTEDTMTVTSIDDNAGIPAKHRVYGIGPDVTIPIATKSKLIALVNARYLWETGAEIKTQGQTLMVTTTFPVGGIKIGAK
jgi:hypothetical protein